MPSIFAAKITDTLKKRIKDRKEYEITRLTEKARFLFQKDPEQSFTLFSQAVVIARDQSSAVILAGTLIEAAECCIALNKFKESLQFFNEAALLNDQLGNSEGLIHALKGISNVHFLAGNYELAISHCSRILDIAEKTHNQSLIAEAHNKLGDLYKFHTNYKKAEEHHQKALQIFKSLNDETNLSITHFFIGNCLNWANELVLAKSHLQKAIDLAKKVGDPQLQTKPLGSMAILQTKEEDFVGAIANFHKSIDLAKMFGDTELVVNLQKSLGKMYHDLGQFDKAIEVLEKSLESSESLQRIYPANVIHGFLAQSYEKVGDYKAALDHHKNYLNLCQKITNEKITLKITELELSLEVDKVKREKIMAEQSSRIKDRIISGISHELRTPLNGIFGMIELLSSTKLTAEQSEYLKTIRLSSSNLLTIINDLIDYSHINQGIFSLNQGEFKLKDTIASIISENLSKANEKKLELILRFDQNIPSVVIGDVQRLSQILNNLISNAIKFTDQGIITVTVSRTNMNALDKSRVVFTITDSGCGIPQDYLPHIFESFAFPDLLKHPQSGSGLGLSVVKNLIDKQHGSISVVSSVGEGTTCTFTLDYRLPKNHQEKAVHPEIRVPTQSKPVHILLVEDNRVNQFLGKQLLNRLNCKVELASDADEALEKLKLSHFDLIFMDIQLPGMNGYDLTKYIRQQLGMPAKNTPIIALTAYASEQENKNALDAGMNGYLTKPYSPNELATVISKFINPSTVLKDQSLMDTLLKRMGGSKKDTEELAEMLLKQIPATITKIEKLASLEKWNQVAEYAHKLKSSIGLLNLPVLTKLISEIEVDSKELKDLSKLNHKIQKLNKETIIKLEILQSELSIARAEKDK